MPAYNFWLEVTWMSNLSAANPGAVVGTSGASVTLANGQSYPLSPLGSILYDAIIGANWGGILGLILGFAISIYRNRRRRADETS